MFVFFFKQKTAYEMRISDWSSDVCSSDLIVIVAVVGEPGLVADRCRDGADRARFATAQHVLERLQFVDSVQVERVVAERPALAVDLRRDEITPERAAHDMHHPGAREQIADAQPVAVRSVEHTSELQSLMRISYAVFCLKKT